MTRSSAAGMALPDWAQARHAPRLQAMLSRADASWHPALLRGLQAVAERQPGYLPALLDSDFLPTQDRLFAAFSQPLDAVRQVLVGEGPYPREASATGVCFMDGAVGALWSAGGLSTAVNRATSLRNFMKMLLVADGRLAPERTSGDALAGIAAAASSRHAGVIQTLAQLQENLLANGFLLLNASLVFRPEVPPVKDARAWQPFMQVVLETLATHANEARRQAPNLVLWGKIAGLVEALPVVGAFPKVVAEHPYNLSFITNPAMQDFFRPMALLHRRDCAGRDSSNMK